MSTLADYVAEVAAKLAASPYTLREIGLGPEAPNRLVSAAQVIRFYQNEIASAKDVDPAEMGTADLRPETKTEDLK